MNPNPCAGEFAPAMTAMASRKTTTSTALAALQPGQPYPSVPPPAMNGALLAAMSPLQLLPRADSAPVAPPRKLPRVSLVPAAKAAMKHGAGLGPLLPPTTCRAPAAVRLHRSRPAVAPLIAQPVCPKVPPTERRRQPLPLVIPA